MVLRYRFPAVAEGKGAAQTIRLLQKRRQENKPLAGLGPQGSRVGLQGETRKANNHSAFLGVNKFRPESHSRRGGRDLCQDGDDQVERLTL